MTPRDTWGEGFAGEIDPGMLRPLKRMRDLTRPVRSSIRNRRKALQWALVGLYQRTCVRLDQWSEPYRIPLQEARARRIRSRLAIPVIGITGSSGKSTAVALLSGVLVPKGITAASSIGNSRLDAIRTLLRSGRQADFVIVEVGASKVGGIAPIAELLRPSVVIVTKVGVEHYSVFRGKEGLAREKSDLVAALAPDGMAVLNADDPLVMAMAERTAAQIVTFGLSEGADYRVTEVEDGLPRRMSLVIECSRGRFRVHTRFVHGSFWLSTAATFAAAVELGIEPTAVAERLAQVEPVRSRMQLVETAEGVTFVLDTAKAPAESVIPSLDLLARATVSYKTAVIGQISDYPGNSRIRYRDAYRRAREVADRVVFVGDNIHKSRASEDDERSGVYAGFFTTQEAADHIRDTVRPGELVFIKSSPNLHLERIALAQVADVRCWVPKCGKMIDCITCGLFHRPFDEHTR